MMLSGEWRAAWAILLNLLLAVTTTAMGIYVLIEKQLLIFGKLIGHIYHFNRLESWMVAISFFLVSAFLVLYLFQNKIFNRIGEWLLGIAILLFLLSSFVTS